MKRLFVFLLLLAASRLPAQRWLQLTRQEPVNYFLVENAYREWRDSLAAAIPGNSLLRILHHDETEAMEEQLEESQEQFFRWSNEVRWRTDADGTVLSEEAMRRRQDALARRNGTDHFQQAQGSWIERGPFSVNYAYSSVRGIGRTGSVAVNLVDTNIVYAAASGVLWRSADNGISWVPYVDSARYFPVSFVWVDPLHGDTLYVVAGGQLFKSTDEGHSWMPLVTGAGSLSSFKMLIDPVNTQRLLLITTTINQSLDGGLSWTQINSSSYRDIEMKPGNPMTLYGLGGTNLFYRSTDGGYTFTCTDTVTGASYAFSDIAVTPADSDYVYLLSANTNGSGGLVAVSVNGGSSFSLRPNSTTLFNAYGMHGLDVSPTDKNVLIQTGIDCFRSADGGMTWALAASWNQPNSASLSYLHVDNRFVSYYGHSFWLAHDGGISKSENDGLSFADRSNGIGNGVFYSIACSRSDTSVFMAGALDDAALLHTSSGWYNAFGGDGYNVAIHPANPQIIYGKNQYSYQRSFNGGVTTNTTGFSGLTESIYGFTAAYPVVFNMQNPHSVYLLASNVWKSTNDGNSVVPISSFSGGTGGGFLYVCETDSNVIFTKYYHTTNGGLSWNSNSRFVLAVDPDEPNKVWGMNTSAEAPGIYFSTDTGATWVAIPSGDLPYFSTANLCCVNNAWNGVFIYLGPWIYYYDERLSNWQEFNNGLPYVSVNDMNVLYGYDRVRIGTAGRGIFESGLYDANQPPQAAFYSDKDSVCPGSTVHFYDNSLNNGPGFNPVYHWYFPGGNPSFSAAASPVVSYAAAGDYNVSLALVNANGADSVTQTFFIHVSMPPQGTTPVSEDFESGTFYPAGWNVNNQHPLPVWQLSPVFQNMYGGFSQSPHSIRYNRYYGAVPAADLFTTPVYDLTSVTNPILFFDLCYAYDYTPSLADTLKIYYTTDCSQTRNYLYVKGGMQLKTDSIYANYAFTMDSTSWRKDTVDLWQIATLGNVQFGFEAVSKGRCDLYIDNINLSQGPGNPLSTGESQGDVFAIYPNPAGSEVQLRFPPSNAIGQALAISDVNGKVMYSQQLPAGSSSASIDVSRWPAGIYFCCLTDGAGMKLVQKLGVTH